MMLEIFPNMLVFLKSKKRKTLLITFFEKLVTIVDICKAILALDASNATQSDGMTTKIIKNNFHIFSKFF